MRSEEDITSAMEKAERSLHSDGFDEATAEKALDNKFMDLYSRQIGTFGLDTMVKLITLKVLIHGARGIGVEAAKNLALAGVHTITLFDPAVVETADLGSNFALNESHVGKTSRAAATAALIAELNPNTRIKVTAEFSDEVIQAHDCVVVTGLLPRAEIAHINEVCRSNTKRVRDAHGLPYEKPSPISFILAYQPGPLATVFVDHGRAFFTRDPDGRAPLQKAITEVVHREENGVKYTRIRFTTPEGMTPGSLGDDAFITFSEVQGMCDSEGNSINNSGPWRTETRHSDPANTIRIGYTGDRFSEYLGGGFVHQHKVPVERNFRSFFECIVAPPPVIFTNCFMDGSAENKVHLVLSTLLEYVSQHNGQLPPLRDAAAVEECLTYARDLLALGKRLREVMPSSTTPAFWMEDFDESFFRRVFEIACVELQPIATILGAIVCQEVVKITGKYTPIEQFLHLNCIEILPDESPSDAQPCGSRYDHMIAVYGKDFHSRLQNMKLFMVGCGALGCEYLKNFALLGICCGPNGALTVTDNDNIEVSNLNRQFLFREENVGKPKSVTARARAIAMNKNFSIKAQTDFVGPTTEHVFTDYFWRGLDAVCNALDNITARMYVDGQCVLFEKILIEAGTMGTAGNVDIVVPHKTNSYADGGQADETGGIPMCTLRNFPYIYDHCIEWARAQFEDLFVSPVMMTQQLRENPKAFVDKLRHDTLVAPESEGVKRSLVSKNLALMRSLIPTLRLLQSQPTIEDCVALASNVFHAQFRDRIRNLITTFPATAKKRNGESFWSGHRRFPHAAELCLTDSEHISFMVSCANLFACMLGIHGAKHIAVKNETGNRWMAKYRTASWLKGAMSNVVIPEYKYSSVGDLDEESSAAASDSSFDPAVEEREFNALLEEVAALAATAKVEPHVVEFEKDDDDNFHIDFVAAAANLRARNYEIATQDRHHVKMVAGKIIPAIATTTAAVTGFALLEFFKALLGKPTDQLKNGMIDVGCNNYVLFDRDPPQRIKTRVIKTYIPEHDYTEEHRIIASPEGFTKYDKIYVDLDRATTVQQFADTLKGKLEGEFEIVGLGCGTAALWNGLPKHSNTHKPLWKLIEDAGLKIEGKRIFNKLSINIENEDGDEVEIPTVVLRLHP